MAKLVIFIEPLRKLARRCAYGRQPCRRHIPTSKWLKREFANSRAILLGACKANDQTISVARAHSSVIATFAKCNEAVADRRDGARRGRVDLNAIRRVAALAEATTVVAVVAVMTMMMRAQGT